MPTFLVAFVGGGVPRLAKKETGDGNVGGWSNKKGGLGNFCQFYHNITSIFINITPLEIALFPDFPKCESPVPFKIICYLMRPYCVFRGLNPKLKMVLFVSFEF